MRTFVEFIQLRNKTKTYLSTQFTVLALYSEYVAWLHLNEAATEFTTSQLLMQLEIINKYQIYLLNNYALSNNLDRPITLAKVPDYLITEPKDSAALQQLITAYKNNLPNAMTETIEGAKEYKTLRSALPLLALSLALAAAFFAAATALLALTTVPLLAGLLLKPLIYVAGFSAAGTTVQLTLIASGLGNNGFRSFINSWKNSFLTDTTHAFIALLGVALVATIVFAPIAPLTAALLEPFSFFLLFMSAEMMISKKKSFMLESRFKAAEPMAIINALDQTGDNNRSQPIFEHLQAKIQPEEDNGLKKAVDATMHCFLASRNILPEITATDESLDIDDLDKTLAHRRSMP